MIGRAEEIVERLGLEPHPEGGWFCESYRAPERLAAAALPKRYGGERSFATAIYYLVTADSWSALHRVASDEVFHFYAGDPVQMLWLHPDGSAEQPLLGLDLGAGQRPQRVVPAGVWQGARPVEGGEWALLGATVAPGFDFADFEMGERQALTERFPAHAEAIRRFTRGPGGGS